MVAVVAVDVVPQGQVQQKEGQVAVNRFNGMQEASQGIRGIQLLLIWEIPLLALDMVTMVVLVELAMLLEVGEVQVRREVYQLQRAMGIMLAVLGGK
jgi:hypothetical protein